MYSKETPENGIRDAEEGSMVSSVSYGEKEVRGKIKLQSHYAEEVIQQRAGFYGYLLQIVYQVGLSRFCSVSFHPKCSFTRYVH